MNSKARLLERTEGLLTAIEEANRAEDEAYGDRDLEEPGKSAKIDAERLQETIAQINRQKAGLALRRYRHQARDNLLSEHGSRLRKQRGTVLEGSFGNIKHNLGFQSFHLRRLVNVEIGLGLICLAHNIRKLGQLKSKGN